jgi:hypothetical protein
MKTDVTSFRFSKRVTRKDFEPTPTTFAIVGLFPIHFKYDDVSIIIQNWLQACQQVPTPIWEDVSLFGKYHRSRQPQDNLENRNTQIQQAGHINGSFSVSSELERELSF